MEGLSLLPIGQLVDVSAPTVARVAGLRYVGDHQPGIHRRRSGKAFRYFRADGRPLTDEQTLDRIRRLAVPPAWTRVWICPHPDGHIQAVGRDAKGRKQYRYHPRWRSVRDSTKYEKMLGFAAALPRIRERVDEDLARPGLPREKVLATVVRRRGGREPLDRIGRRERLPPRDLRRRVHREGLPHVGGDAARGARARRVRAGARR